MTTIARRWWRSVDNFNYRDDDRVCTILQDRQDLVPALSRALVSTPPNGQPRQIGTSILEDLSYGAEFEQKPNKALELLVASRLDNESNVAVLAGVWPDMREEWGCATSCVAF